VIGGVRNAKGPFFREELLMTRLSSGLVLIATLMTTGVASLADAAVTPQVLINFDGTLAGTTYTLGAGELDNSFTFGSNGLATVSGGIGDIPGDLDATGSGPGGNGSGFYFNGVLLGLGSLQNVSWVTEALVAFDVPVASQPATFNHILDVQGDTFLRFDGNGHNPRITNFGYWDGSNEQINAIPDLPTNGYSHVALVWDAPNTKVEAFVNGASQGVVDLAAFDVSSPNVGYGFFSRFLNRAIDGKLDAVAFSTYTGAFNAATDFQLSAVPEPSSLALASLVLAGLAGWKRK
jgi:hypothetical protein